MEIITVMNYDSPEGIQMCKGWFYFMNRFNPQANIKVFYKDKIDGIYEFGSKYSNVEFIELDYDGNFLTHDKMLGCGVVPSQDLTLATWRWVEEHHLNKFLCVEADAWTLAPLDEFWDIANEKPYIGITERIKFDRPSINTGVYSYNSQDGFMSYTRLMEEYYRSGGILAILGDQWLTNNLFRHIDYDFTHPKIGLEYNCWALNCHIEKVNDQDIIIYYGEKYKPERARMLPNGRYVNKSMRGWSGFFAPVNRAKVLHSAGYKFWELPECQELWNYAIEKISQIEHAEV